MKLPKSVGALNPLGVLRSWRDYRQAQLEMLRESNRLHPDPVTAPSSPVEQSVLGEIFDHDPINDLDELAGVDDEPGVARAGVSGGMTGSGPSPLTRFGEAGSPINRRSPFYIGFVGATGVFFAWVLWSSIGRLTMVITLLLVSMFLTLALNPLVEGLTRRKMPRALGVTIVFAGVVVVFALLGWLVIPPVVQQATEIVTHAPSYLQQFVDLPWVQRLDRDYQVLENLQTEMSRKLTDEAFLQQILGGLLGAGRVVASGVFQTLTVLILSLYFLASLPTMKQAALAMVPASRRVRVESLSEEIMRRVGSYAIGQVAIATVNAIASWVMMTILDIPYAAVLAVAVGFLGLIPMVGATLGAAVVSTVAFFDEPRKAVIAIIYYVIYQQIENYLFVPRIMQRTVSVPGAVTVVAALTGGTLLGMLGALLAIPAAAGLLLLYEEVLVPRQQRH